MSSFADRKKKYNTISNALAQMSNRHLEQILSDGQAMHKGIGGTSVQIKIEGNPVFVKKVPITDLEIQPVHTRSTANVFNLPMCYQYGIGSAGFGAWRELAAHKISTEWVLTEQCPNFPMMYHWKIFKDCENKTLSEEEIAALERDTQYWENNQPIHHRLKALALATHHIYLFMEYIPTHLYDWLSQQLLSSPKRALSATQFVAEQMQQTNQFMRSQHFLHMDAHFKNILTDGERLYYGDLGLALSDTFTLSDEEKDFTNKNTSYDTASSGVNLLHCILSTLNKDIFFEQSSKVEEEIRENGSASQEDIPLFKILLEKYLEKTLTSNIDSVDRIIRKYAPITIIMDEFYAAIQKDKTTPYPFQEIEGLLGGLGVMS